MYKRDAHNAPCTIALGIDQDMPEMCRNDGDIACAKHRFARIGIDNNIAGCTGKQFNIRMIVPCERRNLLRVRLR